MVLLYLPKSPLGSGFGSGGVCVMQKALSDIVQLEGIPIFHQGTGSS